MAEKEFADFEIEHDFTTTEAWGGEGGPKLPPGEYELIVIGVENKTYSTGNSGISVTFAVPEDAAEHGGSRAYNNYMTGNGTGLKRLKALMVACGADLSKFKASEIMGARIRATVTHTEGNAQPQPDGTVKAGGSFVNVINERPLHDEEPAAKETAKQPPVTNKAAAAKPNTTAAPKPGTNATPRRQA